MLFDNTSIVVTFFAIVSAIVAFFYGKKRGGEKAFIKGQKEKNKIEQDYEKQETKLNKELSNRRIAIRGYLQKKLGKSVLPNKTTKKPVP